MTEFPAGLLLAVPFLLWGLISPRSQWQLLSSWAYRDPDANEPSVVAYALTRISCGLLLGVLAFVAVSSAVTGES